MKEEELFAELCRVLDTLLGPEGCPWDQKQTLQTLRHSALEEACELIDAIEERDAQSMADELGDLMFNVLFLAKVAAKEGHFTLSDSLQKIIHKLISRHPHVFGDGKDIHTPDEVMTQWEKLKKQEKSHQDRKSAMDGIPKALPALLRAQKMIGKMAKSHFQEPEAESFSWDDPTLSEERFGLWLFEQVKKAKAHGLDAELSLRRACALKEKSFRDWEANQ